MNKGNKGNVLFNDALNTFYLRLYVVGNYFMVKNNRCRHTMVYFFFISNKRYFYMHQPADMIAHTTVFITSVVEHWLEEEINQWVNH